MKIAAHDADRACRQPADNWVGILLYGPDAGLVAESRRQIVKAVTGPDVTDLQITRIPAADARKSPADVDAALTTRGFFSGRPIVTIEGATDGLAQILEPVLAKLTTDDGLLVVTADNLPARSKLRKLFELGQSHAAIGLYRTELSPAEIEDAVRAAGAAGITRDAVRRLAELASGMDYGAFKQLLGVIGLYGTDRADPLDEADIEALVPLGLDGDIDDLVMDVADGGANKIGPMLRRLRASGANAVSILLALGRHFRALLGVAVSDGGIATMRPPPYGPRRDRIGRQLRRWDVTRLEEANRLIFETDARLRSSSAPPEFPLLERVAMRIAIMGSK